MQTAMVRRGLVAALGLAAGLLLLLPLRLAPGLLATGIAAESVEGSLWSGQLRAARWHGLALGDVRVGVSPVSLLGGNLRFSLAGPALQGSILRGGTNGVAGLSGKLALGGGLPLPIAGVSFDGVDAEFSGGACRRAAGQVRLVPAGALAAATGGEALSGAIRCDGAQLLLPLAMGPARFDMRIDAGGRYRATIAIAIAGADPAGQSALLAAGFAPTPDGAVAILEGSL
jgi:general secretion pathway protein N